MKKTKDIFISYKRSDGASIAEELYDAMMMAGYSVFLDKEILQSGKYEDTILQRIKESTDFIVIVTPSFQNDSEVDWILKEYLCAVESDCNIIPLYYIDPSSISSKIGSLNAYNGINAANVELVEVVSQLVDRLLLSDQDISYKRDESKEELDDFSDYMHRHTARAFVELVRGALQDGEICDANHSMAILAQETDYDVIACMWVLVFKCRQLIDSIPDDVSENFYMVKSMLSLVEDTLAQYAILIDEGKLDTANRFFPNLRNLLVNIIEVIGSDKFEE